ncbi:hypothetical protein L596_012869 [Steinernema carpocapsae]|uniref:G-protein coupled receptors family 1 profile domain-containing protein n=1 Tax=Steinernema carpocapsae TaxID=34508 RepID=A0A4U5NZ55_STECR|nr:hypothetical protein L596_012869 [Steinernema carpocapsae]
MEVKCNGTIMGLTTPDEQRRIMIAYVYLSFAAIGIPISTFVLAVFMSNARSANSCYKLLTITSIFDLTDLIIGSLVCGLISLFNWTPCNGHRWTNYVGNVGLASWFSYSAASEVLALDRMLVFVNDKWSEALFSGRKAWIWSLYVVVYVGISFATYPEGMYYVYDPYAGVIHDGKYYVFHIVSNFMKLIVVTGMYIIMCIGVIRKVSKYGSTGITYQIKVRMYPEVAFWTPFSLGLTPDSRSRSPKRPKMHILRHSHVLL